MIQSSQTTFGASLKFPSDHKVSLAQHAFKRGFEKKTKNVSGAVSAQANTGFSVSVGDKTYSLLPTPKWAGIRAGVDFLKSKIS